MSLNGTLNVGKTALTTHQAAIQVSSNNIANVNTPGYTRQVAKLAPNPDEQLAPGLFVGTGVDLDSISRAIDESLNGRLRSATSDGESGGAIKQWLGRIESTFNELSDEDLSTRLSTFFTSWSNLANKPQDIGLRQIVVQAGDSVASWMRDLRTQLKSLSNDVNDRLASLTTDADALARQIADMNRQITQAEGGGTGPANGLRDQRDQLLSKLSEMMNIETRPQEGGAINVYVNSVPLVLDSTSRGVGLRQETTPQGEVLRTVVFKSDDSEIGVTAGQIGGLSTVKDAIEGTLDQVDSLANNMIFELNKLHASGQGLEGFSAIQSANAVTDTTAALNDADLTQLKFTPTNGSFVVHVRNKQSGLTTSTLVQVDLDGLNGDDTSLDDLANAIDGIAGISANSTGGRLNVAADSATTEISFSQDSSGVLAALGVNTFFTGAAAGDIAVNTTIKARPQLLAASKNGQSADNQTALAIARLEGQSLSSLGGVSLKSSYQNLVNGIASQAARAQSDAEAADSIKETLSAQREAISGVSLDEEAVNLMRSQRAFQGAARVIAVVDEMMQTVLGLVR